MLRLLLLLLIDPPPGQLYPLQLGQSAKDFGAVGDAVDVADDQPSLQLQLAAIDAAQRTAQTSTLWPPAGVYTVKRSLLGNPFRHDVRNSEWTIRSRTMSFTPSPLCDAVPRKSGARIKSDDGSARGLPSFDYILYNVNLTQYPHARCLDGTPGSYYFRKSSNTKKYFLFHEGGGWCSPDVPFTGGVGIDHCYNRSLGSSGSSKYNSAIKPLPLAGTSGAYFSYDNSTNPILFDANSVLINYCDGGAFSGRRREPMTILGRSLYFQGSFMLDAVAADLRQRHGMTRATEVVVGGCSAGGHAAILQVDSWRARLPPTAFVVGLPDSGFFLDWGETPLSTPLHSPSRSFHTDLGSIFAASNASVNQACVSAHVSAGADPTKCFFAEHTMPYVQTPTFLLQSIHDAWQTGNILGSSDPLAVNSYGREVAARLTELAFAPRSTSDAALSGGFIDACWHHCSDKQWFVESIDGVTMRDAFTRWYTARKKEWQSLTEIVPASPDVYWQRQQYPCSSCCVAPNRTAQER